MGESGQGFAPAAAIVIPDLGGNGAIGGTSPPFLNKIYKPSHPDLAALIGARAHDWPYGDIPPFEGITKAEVSGIIAYARSLQAANEIF